MRNKRMYSKKKTNRNDDTKQIIKHGFEYFDQTLFGKVQMNLLPPFLVLYVSFFFFLISIYI